MMKKVLWQCAISKVWSEIYVQLSLINWFLWPKLSSCRNALKNVSLHNLGGFCHIMLDRWTWCLYVPQPVTKLPPKHNGWFHLLGQFFMNKNSRRIRVLSWYLIIAFQSQNIKNDHLTQPWEGPGLNAQVSRYPRSSNKQLLLWKNLKCE